MCVEVFANFMMVCLPLPTLYFVVQLSFYRNLLLLTWYLHGCEYNVKRTFNSTKVFFLVPCCSSKMQYCPSLGPGPTDQSPYNTPYFKCMLLVLEAPSIVTCITHGKYCSHVCWYSHCVINHLRHFFLVTCTSVTVC